MTRVRIGRDYVANIDALVGVLRGERMAAVVRAAGETVADRARSLAPVQTGAFRDAIRVILDEHPDRVVAHIGSTDRKSLIVESRAHVMRRAVG